jgi:hypothetical protein
MAITNFNTYFINSLKTFFLAFIIGKSINNFFVIIQTKYKHKNINNIVYGILQLITVILSAYYLHILSSNTFSNNMQIYAPNVLFSSFIFALQTNMINNLDIML